MHYLELDPDRQIKYFSRNGQCAAGSGAFWYQQATRMGYNDRELAEIALEADSAISISGRCAVFAKSDMTHAINEGATQQAVSAGMAKALVENVLTSVAQNRITKEGHLVVIGGVAGNKAIIKYLRELLSEEKITVSVPDNYEYINAMGAAIIGPAFESTTIEKKLQYVPAYKPENPLPPLKPERVIYSDKKQEPVNFDLSKVYIGVDCGSVSTKCVLVDGNGLQIGGVYLPTTGKPALQVLELMKKVESKYGNMLVNSTIIACTTGSGRYLSQKILSADYAVDEITCQAEGIKHLYPREETLSIIEIGGEDSKFIKLKNGALFDYSMNPVCAAGTGTFLENLADLLDVDVKCEFSEKSFSAAYAVDLGDICTLISQSILASASAVGLPLNEQLASLAYSSAKNYLSKTVDKRSLDGKVVFAGATAKNHALAAALSTVAGKKIYIPPEPELTGALGSALMARKFHLHGIKSEYSFRKLSDLQEFKNSKYRCKAECRYDHNCELNVITFADEKKFIYGDRCGKYSDLEKRGDRYDLPDYCTQRMEIMDSVIDKVNSDGQRTRVGIARCGLYYDYYPFWATFLNELGCEVIQSNETSTELIQKGKKALDSEMCYPMKVIVGHYSDLSEMNLDYIFLPEVINMDALPWADNWPRSFTCPLLQTLKGTIVNSLQLNDEKLLYAQLNYRAGPESISEQLRPTAKRILSHHFSEKRFKLSVQKAYRKQEEFRLKLVKVAENIFFDLKNSRDHSPVVFLSRGYTLYDQFVSKNSVLYARQSGLTALPGEYFLVYLQAWYTGEIESTYLDPYRDEFKTYLQEQVGRLVNIYPAQLQKMLSIVFLMNFLNGKRSETGLPLFNLIFLDPFKCGPNAMMRHYLEGLTNYLRLTLDEHTAAAGMITRLEAFKNTCLSNKEPYKPVMHNAGYANITDGNWTKMLIPYPTEHSHIFAALFRSRGIDAEVLPRNDNGDMSLARRYTNGEECLPFIQNLQDFLHYLNSNGGKRDNGEVFFQGWACGPCRYGLYAPVQSLAVDRAGCGSRKVSAVRFNHIRERFGLNFLIIFFNGLLAMDLLYKMLHRVRPYEKEKGGAGKTFIFYRDKLTFLLENYRNKPTDLLTGTYRKPIEELIKIAAEEFSRLENCTAGRKPRILLSGEFYVRLDDRCNQSVIRKIEESGGEVCLSPATELFSYTLYIDLLEAKQSYKSSRKASDFIKQTGYSLLLKLARRDEVALEKAAGALLHGLEEPTPKEIRERALKYVSGHYGGEPPMTIGRTSAFAERERVSGAIFVAPFTCMPASVVEAQQAPLQEDLGIPIVSIYYDGKNNNNRDELVQCLVYQARQKLKR